MFYWKDSVWNTPHGIVNKVITDAGILQIWLFGGIIHLLWQKQI